MEKLSIPIDISEFLENLSKHSQQVDEYHISDYYNYSTHMFTMDLCDLDLWWYYETHDKPKLKHNSYFMIAFTTDKYCTEYESLGYNFDTNEELGYDELNDLLRLIINGAYADIE